MIEKLKVVLHNICANLRVALVGPQCCGLWKNPDGRLVECDEWWGYQECMFPGCGHYQLEHSDGTPNKVIYVRPGSTLHSWEMLPNGGAGCTHCHVEQTDANRDEECPKTVKKGDLIGDPVGCLNAGCEDCPEFWDKAKLHNFIQELACARHHATHMMFRDDNGVIIPNVKHVDSNVSIVVQVTTTVMTRDREALNAVFKREQAIMDKFPNVLFNFDVTFEQPDEIKAAVEDSIK